MSLSPSAVNPAPAPRSSHPPGPRPPPRSEVPYLATFFIFAPVGVLVGLIQARAWPPVPGLVMATIAGFISLGWAWTLQNLRRRWPAFVALNTLPFVVPEQLFRLLSSLGVFDPGAGLGEMPRRIILAVIAVVSVSVGFTLLVGFIRRQQQRSERLRTEIDLAQKIHATLVPPIALRTARFDVQGRSTASSEMGGDLIDAVLADGRVDLYLADVSGHGVGAGLVMGMVKSALRMRLEPGLAADLPLLLRDLNRVVTEVSRPGIFVTFAAVRLDADGVHSALAGHLPVLHWRAADRTLHRLDNQSLPLGVDSGERFHAHLAAIASGDLLVLYTDGLTETQNPAGQLFGLDRLERAVARHADLELPALLDALLAEVAAFGPQTDDRTLLLARVR